MAWADIPDPIDRRTPVDELEPVEEHPYREAAHRLRDQLERIVNYVLTAENRTLAIWAVAFAYETQEAKATSQSRCAMGLGVTRQALSKEITKFCRRVDIPPPIHGKPDRARRQYRAICSARHQARQTA